MTFRNPQKKTETWPWQFVKIRTGVDDKIVRKETVDREGSGQSCDILRAIYLGGGRGGAVQSLSHTTRHIICFFRGCIL